ncbi:MAG TPA: SDR family oxidoreductase [Gordonia sp. (in: high G+C Gram-positive bacteria)]|uniref:SDR family NAD(P)-dependent oxidoreductase n=1 Tax=unclassified Gordonia (in: high G+C Gram-positive bacteria) TaxID=2657482 RepID=UPI0025BA28FE|nr:MULTISPECIES: SDR family oxidoreductase [unclassified Gordonia (in: high G+C Gram-positive bacteria)]HNP55846.1 SDR family oxidoreductase [Gordonia sp. (in: high G+C Gram-positive bacteria)]HRC50931.1 SDR family oxidoreductase [Gordonia sp. (in: high G+C Gram-positive bacteria)]
MKLQSKVLVVTGGGAGIGRATVLELLSRGAEVAAVDISEAGLKETADLADAGDRLSLHPLDITDREQVLALPASVADQHGKVDGLVNIAGIIQPFVDIIDLDFDVIERVINVNFWGTVNMVKAFLPILVTRPESSIVNVASMGALVPVPGQSAYGASKAAVSLLTEGLYAELRGSNISITEVFPGAVNTGITENSGVERPGDVNEGLAEKLATSPEDAAIKIATAIEKEKLRVRIGKDAVLFDLLGRVMPQTGIKLVAKALGSFLSD